MSSLPSELLDVVVDHLHDEPTPLKACCTVSKSWVPRARKHLFARVEFHVSGSNIGLWKMSFPDPSNSPAHHTCNLSIHGPQTITAADASEDGWIPTFRNVVLLEFSSMSLPSLLQFTVLSPTVRSLRLTDPPRQVFNLVDSFPLLEDLALVYIYQKSAADESDAPWTQPNFTRILNLRTFASPRLVTRRFLDLQGDLHLTEINAEFFNHDAESVTDLVSRCSGTLEGLTITYKGAFPIQLLWLTSTSPLLADITESGMLSLDLSSATNLKHLKLVQTGPSVGWIVRALQTVKSKSIQFIGIYPPITLPEREDVHREWQDLDNLLVQFWISHSIRPRVQYTVGGGKKDLRGRFPSLLPELTRRGLVDLVEI